MRRAVLAVLLVVLAFAPTPGVAGTDTVEDLLKKSRAALLEGKTEEALSLAEKAIALEPNAQAYLMRGTIREAVQQHALAIADFDKAVALDPKAAEAYNRRGSEYFKLGQIDKSLADFDKFLELEPAERPGHWKRGITLYYAGRYDDGRKQFAAYEKVDTNDVENAAWHYLCVARAQGVEKARASILKIGKDKRVPLMQVYALYSGRAKPEDVLAAVREGKPSPEELHQRLFYAHLYLGLYYEAAGDKKLALEHMTKAAEDYRVGHFMGDVARVQLALLRKETKSKP